jgi:hypothetical protein
MSGNDGVVTRSEEELWIGTYRRDTRALWTGGQAVNLVGARDGFVLDANLLVAHLDRLGDVSGLEISRSPRALRRRWMVLYDVEVL